MNMNSFTLLNNLLIYSHLLVILFYADSNKLKFEHLNEIDMYKLDQAMIFAFSIQLQC